jgi:hypothetical protein
MNHQKQKKTDCHVYELASTRIQSHAFSGPDSQRHAIRRRRMSNQLVEIKGIYRVPVSDELFAEVMEIKFEGLDLSSSERQQAEAQVREELDSVVLVDTVVSDGARGFNVSDFGQKHANQVAYDEAYLSQDGGSIESRFDRPRGEICRLAFFLHFFNPAHPLETPFGPISVSQPTEMPQTLKDLMPYEPVA